MLAIGIWVLVVILCVVFCETVQWILLLASLFAVIGFFLGGLWLLECHVHKRFHDKPVASAGR